MLIDIPGETIAEKDLTGRRAIEIVRYLKAKNSNHLRLKECRRKFDDDILIIEIDVEVAPRRPVKIAPTEPIMLICPGEGNGMPLVVPLREDFPDDELHITIHDGSELVSLCLWDTPQEDQKARFTPFMFLARIKEWLELAAERKLHQAEQGPEPVLTGTSAQAIIPAGPIDPDTRYLAYGRETLKKNLTVRFYRADDKRFLGKTGAYRFVLIPITTGVVCGRAVRSAPRTLKKLASLVSDHGGDLVQSITDFVTSAKNEKGLAEAIPVILVTFPKSSTPNGEIESQDQWAFTLDKTVAEIGKEMGAYDSAGGFTAALIGRRADPEKLPPLSVDPMIVIQELEAEAVPALSGWNEGFETKCFAIGAGALGGKIVELCRRGGFGHWRVVDKDVFLPHNTVRHVLGDWAIGDPKALHLQLFLNESLPGERIGKPFIEDLEDTDGLSKELLKAISESDLLVDMSASVTVARALSLMSDVPRCVSLFFNPGATDLVMLCEDEAKSLSLLDLEASYYAALVTDERLHSHLSNTDAQGIRYGNGCSDITAQIGPDQVSILGGIGCKALRRIGSSASAKAKIWRMQEDGALSVVNLPCSTFQGQKFEDWDIAWSDDLIEKLAAERAQELPNETGGILLGMVDFEKRLMRICAAIGAPPDSVKRPHYFERGYTGLEARLKEIGDTTAGQLRYLGEWHSHPKNVPARPSADDEKLFLALADLFEATCEPHIMAIISDSELFARIGIGDRVHDTVLAL
ncbi:MAG: Mov34/MPN/PAD-1 family protein [Pseudomonadota bacterium]